MEVKKGGGAGSIFAHVGGGGGAGGWCGQCRICVQDRRSVPSGEVYKVPALTVQFCVPSNPGRNYCILTAKKLVTWGGGGGSSPV